MSFLAHLLPLRNSLKHPRTSSFSQQQNEVYHSKEQSYVHHLN